MWPFSKSKTYELTPTQELLLALLRAQLWLKPVDDISLPSSNEAWDDLLNHAYKQTVVCFIAAACLRHKDAESIPSDIKEELEAVIEENKKIHEHHNAILIELITKFEEQGLHPILLKGQGLAQMYPQPELRQCGDIDIFFNSGEYERAHDYMMLIEDDVYEHSNSEHHYHTYYKGISIEVHKYVSEKIPNPFANNEFRKFTETEMTNLESICINGKEINIPSPLYNIVFVFVHMWRHFEDKGVSLRQVCDVISILSYYGYSADRIFNKKEIFVVLKKISHLRYWKILECILVDYLGLPGYSCDGYDNGFSRKARLMLGVIYDYGPFNHFDKAQLQKLSFFRKRLAIHLYVHREFMKVYPIVGLNIFWRYSAYKKNTIYRLICYFIEKK